MFTPSESGAFACLYAIFVGVVVYREMNWKTFVDTLKSTSKDIGIVMILVAMSGTIGYGIVYDQVPQNMSAFLVGVTESPILMMLIAVVILAFSGMFIETTVIALLMTPILVPVMVDIGVDPVHFGLIMMTVTTMGIMTPPVGIALYTTSQIMGTRVENVAKESLPFLAAVIAVVVIMILFPQLVLFIPDMIFGAA